MGGGDWLLLCPKKAGPGGKDPGGVAFGLPDGVCCGDCCGDTAGALVGLPPWGPWGGVPEGTMPGWPGWAGGPGTAAGWPGATPGTMGTSICWVNLSQMEGGEVNKWNRMVIGGFGAWWENMMKCYRMLHVSKKSCLLKHCPNPKDLTICLWWQSGLTD